MPPTVVACLLGALTGIACWVAFWSWIGHVAREADPQQRDCPCWRHGLRRRLLRSAAAVIEELDGWKDVAQEITSQIRRPVAAPPMPPGAVAGFVPRAVPDGIEPNSFTLTLEGYALIRTPVDAGSVVIWMRPNQGAHWPRSPWRLPADAAQALADALAALGAYPPDQPFIAVWGYDAEPPRPPPAAPPRDIVAAPK